MRFGLYLLALSSFGYAQTTTPPTPPQVTITPYVSVLSPTSALFSGASPAPSFPTRVTVVAVFSNPSPGAVYTFTVTATASNFRTYTVTGATNGQIVSTASGNIATALVEFDMQIGDKLQTLVVTPYFPGASVSATIPVQ